MAKYPPVDYGLRRFVVLHHTGIDQPHFDFMFDTTDGSALVTFRLEAWPLFQEAPCTKLRDHRRAYLDYTGTIAGDRGRVDRVDEGQVKVMEIASGWQLSHADGRPMALFAPTQSETEPEWTVTPL